MSHEENVGERIWWNFNEALGEHRWKAFLIPEGIALFRKAVESYDKGAIEATVLLCRATLEGSFLLFLSMIWHNENSFDIVFPTALDGSLRQVGFDELRNGVQQRVDFSKEQKTAMNRIHKDGNFVAHFASRRIKQRMERVEKLRRWEASREKSVTDRERMQAISELLMAERSSITPEEALQDLRDTASIILTLGKAMGKPSGARERG